MKLGVLEACNSSDNIVKITNDSYLPNYDDLKNKQIESQKDKRVLTLSNPTMFSFSMKNSTGDSAKKKKKEATHKSVQHIFLEEQR